ncbi:MAG: hypothetical protein ACK4G1_08040, partial [Ignavibacteria bacterium]
MKSVRLVLLYLFISLFLFNACKKQKQEPETPVGIDSIKIKFINPYSFADSVLSKKILLVYLDDSTKTFQGIYENEGYGIGFFILDPLDTSNVISYLSELLDGISDGAEIDTINFATNQKFLYYNSGSAFIGSKNLEVYQYLFNPSTRELFKSYCNLSEDGSVLQIFSKNLRDNSKKDLINFF